MSGVDCQHYHGDRLSDPCASCDHSCPPVDLQRLAASVNQRAEQLLQTIPEPAREIDPRKIKQCLDANERGDGVLFADLHADRFLYNVSISDAKKVIPWYHWSGHVWQRDELRRAHNAVEEVAIAYASQASSLSEQIDEERIDRSDKKGPKYWMVQLEGKYLRRAEKLRGKGGVENCLHFAPIVSTRMTAREGDFDQHPWKLPVRNGVINLRTGVLERGNPKDRLTKALDLDYDPQAKCPKFEAYLAEVAANDEVAAFLKRTFGYAITGHSFEQYIWVFTGPGRNGKGVLFSILGDILGPYYHTISRAMILEQRNEPSPAAASEHLYSLIGKRIIVGAETNKGQRIDAGAVKTLTGDDRIKCRPNFRSEVEFDPTHSLFLHCNHLPTGLTKDFALRERLLKIEFPYMYVDDVDEARRKEPPKAHLFRPKDKHLKEVLREEYPGILAWLVQGCLEWQQHGLSPPASIIKAVDDLAAEEDYIGQFLDDCLIHHDDEHVRIPCTRLNELFRWWWAHNMDAQERRTPGIKSVNTQIRDRGHTVEQSGGKTWLYRFSANPLIEDDVADWLKKGGKS